MARLYLDTNILLHAKPLQDILWEEHATPPITIVITTTNIRELDRHKDHHPKRHLRERARRALQRIEAALTNPTIRHQVTIHIDHHLPNFTYETYGLDATHPDDTIIASAIQAKHDQPEEDIIIYTHDVGPRITAARLGLNARELPAEDKLPPQQDETERENERLKRELHDLHTAAPQLRLQINDEAHTATVRTLAPIPPTLNEERITNSARAARGNLPRYETPSTNEPATLYVEARHVLDLDAMGFIDDNAIPSSEYHRYQSDCASYEEEYRTYLRDMHDAIADRAQSLALAFTLHNDGGKPGDDIRITVTTPTTVTITEHPRFIRDPPQPPAPPRTNGELRRDIMRTALAGPGFPSYASFIPPDLNPSQTGPEIENDEITWWVRRLRHTYERDLGTLYVTFAGPIKAFRLSYHLHATNAPKPFKGEILIKPQAMDDI